MEDPNRNNLGLVSDPDPVFRSPIHNPCLEVWINTFCCLIVAFGRLQCSKHGKVLNKSIMAYFLKNCRYTFVFSFHHKYRKVKNCKIFLTSYLEIINISQACNTLHRKESVSLENMIEKSVRICIHLRRAGGGGGELRGPFLLIPHPQKWMGLKVLSGHVSPL